MSDPGQYRTREEVAEFKKRDPVALARTRLVDELGASEETLAEVEREVEAEIADAVEFAESSPPADEYLPYVYKD